MFERPYRFVGFLFVICLLLLWFINSFIFVSSVNMNGHGFQKMFSDIAKHLKVSKNDLKVELFIVLFTRDGNLKRLECRLSHPQKKEAYFYKIDYVNPIKCLRIKNAGSQKNASPAANAEKMNVASLSKFLDKIDYKEIAETFPNEAYFTLFEGGMVFQPLAAPNRYFVHEEGMSILEPGKEYPRSFAFCLINNDGTTRIYLFDASD